MIVVAFTSLYELHVLAHHYLLWQVVLQLVDMWCYLLDGMFIGASRGAEMRNGMVVPAVSYVLTLL